MLDAAIWKQDGTGRKVVRYGGHDGVIVEVIQMTFYRHRGPRDLHAVYRLGAIQARQEFPVCRHIKDSRNQGLAVALYM